MNFSTVRQLDYITFRQARTLGAQFAQWLNATGGTNLVLTLLDLEKEIRALNHEHAKYSLQLSKDGPESDEISDEMSERLDLLMAKFDRLISRCKVYPHLVDLDFSSPEWIFRWDLVKAPRKALKPRPNAHPKETEDDLDALLSIVRLAQFGYLSRLKRCPCDNWYFERVRSQQFCSSKCRQWMFSKSEKFRAHRREYMRRYYKLKMSGVVK
jgi:hypothetical protein